ncbi:esterase/lipase family protein [Massilia atriviolacea]|uniref:esterase/lipase family protein n=1 Tax=Massilia atriviolacea TaxID=2495579 RepID=UPI0038578E3D
MPIIFIPGIMGSNLRMSAARQRALGADNNIAWRPDNLGATAPQYNDSPAERQRRLDPAETEVDQYDPEGNPTGDPKETSDQRNDDVKYSVGYNGFGRLDGPLLQHDLPGTTNARTREQKARARGWGEVYFGSYSDILSLCECHLNGAFSGGTPSVYLKKHIIGVEPSAWQAHARPALKALDEKTLRETVKGCWFPVHAMGYNWLKGNSESGIAIAKRIDALIARYREQGFTCEKVILVSHSMGGLVARAVIHPEMGKLADKVLGIVHGVMPAIGAGAAYKRVRCGFEGSGIGPRILGNTGVNVTPVLGNAQGGLELLPSQAYGNHWLQVQQNGTMLKSLPLKGDPYEEIYKVRGKWFGLLREEWINPAGADGPGFDMSCALLDRAKSFHNAIVSTYHDQSYAHYGADPKRTAWRNVVWSMHKRAKPQNVDTLAIAADDAQGEMQLIDPAQAVPKNKAPLEFEVEMLEAADPGDQTVPVHSADAQLNSGKFKGIFRQSGYEHQASYSDDAVIASTIYSLVRIASTMTWPK